MTKRLTKLVAVVVLVAMLLTTLAACGEKKEPVATVTYNSTTAVMPSNWNEFTYSDGNDTQILSYLGSSLFDYDYKFNGAKYDADGNVIKENIVDGAYTTNYSAATKLEDVTATVDAKWGYTDEQKSEGGYAWKITLRNDLKWHDGTPITAADFEYSMKEILNPEFMNFRANTYYDTLMVKNAKTYFYSKAPLYSPIVPPYGENETPDYSFDMEANDVYLSTTREDMTFAGYSLAWLVDYWGDPAGFTALEAVDNAANEFGFLLITDETLPLVEELLRYALRPFGIVWDDVDAEVQPYYLMEMYYYVSGSGEPMDWENVGCYAIPEENAIVVCLDKQYSFLNEDGSLSVWAPYYMSSLPLVKKDLYEACKVAPVEGATLWTSIYNSSLETSASWGPYMLTEFVEGSHYVLEKNDQWYAYGMEQYQNQYKIEKIHTRKVEEATTRWLGFLAGEYDDGSLDTFNVNEYADSKYVRYAPTTGTYGMQIFSNLKVLKASDNNNGILAIDEFRQAFNLALDRSDIISQIWPGSTTPCFGLVSVAYYYDVENGSTLSDGGIYRNNAIAQAGILRAYGYTQAADGTWSINDMTGLSLEEAYDTLTGYNPVLAKETFVKAVEILEENAEHYGYDPEKEITIVYGSSVDNDKQRFRCNYLQEVLNGLAEGTSLEGKIKLVFDASAGSKWADAFRSGATQIGFGYGFQGNAFNPFDIIGAFVNPDDSLNYHAYWDTSVIDMTLTMPEGDYEAAGETITMSVQNWYFCLNGLAESEDQDYTYNWDAGMAPTEVRLVILSALEELVLQQSRSVMLISDAGGSLLGAQFSYISDSYNTFMGFGGIRYMEVNYNDGEWAAYVAQNNGDLSAEYKKSE